jgi:hypothetical protein
MGVVLLVSLVVELVTSNGGLLFLIVPLALVYLGAILYAHRRRLLD